jgi:hypothetical protein
MSSLTKSEVPLFRNINRVDRQPKQKIKKNRISRIALRRQDNKYEYIVMHAKR